MAKVKGKVKWFDAAKGFGFIAPDNGEKDVFVHISAVKEAGFELVENMEVIFEVQSGRDGRSSASGLEQA